MSPTSHGSAVPRAATGLAAMLDGYVVPAGHYDELLGADRTFRAEWREFAEAAPDLDARSLAQASRRLAHQLHENGVTYNVYAIDGAGAAGRPWTLDVLPTIIREDDWNSVERGVAQWGRLLEAMARDLYGEQRLLREGLLPSSLMLGDRGFLRPCHGVTPPGGTFLHIIALDVVRAPEGGWRVAGVRTQAPSGLGYALENRATISRIFPDALRALRVRPLSPFSDALQDLVAGNAVSDAKTTYAVLMTPGPFNETYFEHVYLARQLGVPLVQGGDLTVRHDCVFLKTVSGLRRVHAIWRRVDDDFCDPLELRADSTLGVPGLLQAWRAGQVLLLNAFGMGVLETPGVLSMMSGVSHTLLGETLLLPAVASWWCGQAEGLERAQQRLSTSVVKNANQGGNAFAAIGAELSDDERREWLARIEGNPEAFVVQDAMPPSHTATFRDDGLESRAQMLRVFLLADGLGGYRVLPGGLCRIAGEDRHRLSSRFGGSSKDVWVMSASPVDPAAAADFSPDPERTTLGERTTSSRAAESLFWLGRYAERSENAARLLRATLHRLTAARGWPAGFQRLLIRTCRNQGLLRHDDLFEISSTRPTATAGESSRYIPDGAIALALMEGVFDSTTRHSLAFDVAQMVRVAGSVRDRLSSDNWRVLNRLSQQLSAPRPAPRDLNDTLDVLDDAVVSLVAVGGLEMAHMTRDDGWRFLSLGRHLERLAFVSATLDDVAAEGGATDSALLEWLLDLSDSLITYRARHMRRAEWPGVLDLLLFDERNPRSAMFQVSKLGKHVRLLPDADLIDIAREIDRVHALGRVDDGRQGDLFGEALALERLPSACAELARSLSDALALRYFSHVYDLPHATVTP